MMIHDLIGNMVTFYLVGGHIITGQVRNITSIEFSEPDGRIGRYSVLVVIHNSHTTLIRADRVVTYEIH